MSALHGIFDTHAHYDDERFDGDRDELLASLPGQGVCGVVNAASDLAAARRSIALAERYPFFWAAAGIHPHEAADAPLGWEDELRDLLEHPRVVALGEIGLDYHYDFSPRETQRALFERQLRLAKEKDVPVVIHDREAHEDALRLLQEFRPRGVVHCFSGSVEMARELLRRGWYLGFDGPITYKNAVKALDVIAACPTDRMLLETDSPYLSPVPNRGKRNDSRNLPYIAARIAEIKGMTTEEVAEVTLQNGKQLFGL